MSRWGHHDVPVTPLLPPEPPPGSVSVEQALLERLSAVRAALVAEASDREWDEDAVDRIMAAGGLEPYTREYIASYVVEESREIRVRGRDKTDASSRLTLGQNATLVGMREAEGGRG